MTQNIDVILMSGLLDSASVGTYKLHKVVAAAVGKFSVPIWRGHNAHVISSAEGESVLFDAKILRSMAGVLFLQFGFGSVVCATIWFTEIDSMFPFNPDITVLGVLLAASMLYQGICGWLPIYSVASPKKVSVIVVHLLGILAVWFSPFSTSMISIAITYTSSIMIICIALILLALSPWRGNYHRRKD